MAEIIQCPKCRGLLQIDSRARGQWFKCPTCLATFMAPAAPQPSAAPATPAAARPPTPVGVAPPVFSAAPPARPSGPEVPPWSAPPVVNKQPEVHPEFQVKKEELLPPVAHRGYLVLALGFVGLCLFCISPIGWILGGVAVSLGGDDLSRMQRGTMDKSGELMTLLGRLSGMIAVILATVASLWWIFYFLLRAGSFKSF
jgi:hypothetical protein